MGDESAESRRAKLNEDRKIVVSSDHAGEERTAEFRAFTLSSSMRGVTYKICFAAMPKGWASESPANESISKTTLSH